jgi:hypothetical protein
MQFTASVDLNEKVERLKGLLAHRHPNLSLGELFDNLCDLGLAKWDSAKFAAPRKRCVISRPSQAQTIRNTFREAKNHSENCGSSYALEIDHINGRSSNSSKLRLRNFASALTAAVIVRHCWIR